jgi:hypothetical protein
LVVVYIPGFEHPLQTVFGVLLGQIRSSDHAYKRHLRAQHCQMPQTYVDELLLREL